VGEYYCSVQLVKVNNEINSHISTHAKNAEFELLLNSQMTGHFQKIISKSKIKNHKTKTKNM